MRRPPRTGKSNQQKRSGPHGGTPQRNQGPPRRPPQDRNHHAPRPKEPPHPQGPRERVAVQGILEMHDKGYAFLRDPARTFAAQPNDAYVSAQMLQQYKLREGLAIAGQAESAPRGGPRLVTVETIEGQPADQFHPRKFDDLTAIDPHQMIMLETGAEPLTTRVMDMLTPIGKGTRGLIVAPPRTGKTILLQHIAKAVAVNHPEMHLMVLLIDERPEEVTEIRRTVKGEVFASSSDHDALAHARLAELVFERAKRLVELGRDVFVLLDSITRLSRAYNKNIATSGRTLSGGIDARAMEVPRRLFGSARVFEEGGSLTVLGTALVETGSRMDDYIFQEFKGTGNMELVLDRKLADRRIFPALDVTQSGTRKEERLLSPETLQRVTLLRRSMVKINPIQGMETLVKRLAEYPSNAEFLEKVATYVR